MSRVTTYIALAILAVHALARVAWGVLRLLFVAVLIPFCVPLVVLSWMGRKAMGAAEIVRSDSSARLASCRVLALSDAIKKNPSADPRWFAERLAEV